MITREQVADLQPGDVVELRDERWPNVVMRGPVHQSDEHTLSLGVQILCHRATPWAPEHKTLTVVSRAPRPLYVNHPRTEPVDHDVVRDGEGAIRHCDAAGFGGKPTWWGFGNVAGCKWTHTTFPPQPLTLLVDGETGEVVP